MSAPRPGQTVVIYTHGAQPFVTVEPGRLPSDAPGVTATGVA